MIAKATRDFPDIEWITADVSDLMFDSRYDIVFSNAAIQWMPDHDLLLPRLFEIVNAGGALAVQVPKNEESPLHRAVLSVASNPRWSRFTTGAEKSITYHNPEYYYNMLSHISSRFDLWEGIYYHVLSSHSALVEWYKGSGMRPFLERLPDEASCKEFEDEVLADCIRTYPLQRNGKVLYPFRRIFFIAYP
jgi:trans-aconitate 2-methyltransferase